MNSGYISVVLIVVSLILFASGWKNTLMKGVSRRSIIVFFAGWLLLTPVQLPVGRTVVNGVVGLLAAAAVAGVWRLRSWIARLQALSAALLLGAVGFFLLETVHLTPAFMVINAEFTIALWLSLLCAGLVQSPAAQLAVISFGLLIGEGLHSFFHGMEGELGGAAFRDTWWMTALMTRSFALALQLVVTAMKRMAGFVAGKWRGDGHSGQ